MKARLLLVFLSILTATSLVPLDSDALGVPDRDEYYGYFNNARRTTGHDVIEGGVYSQNAEELIGFIRNKLQNGTPQDRTGAAFIVQTMLRNGSRNRDPISSGEFDQWADRVRYAQDRGRVNWNNYNSNIVINSMYQGQRDPGSRTGQYDDDTFFRQRNAITGETITFYNENGAVIYEIRKDCANPVGEAYGLEERPRQWSYSGDTTVDGPRGGGQREVQVYPGEEVQFNHYAQNTGNTRARTDGYTNIRYPNGTSNAINATSIEYNPGERQLMRQNIYRIPSDAQVGDRFCQYVGFSPAAWNNGGGVDFTGPGQIACAVVQQAYNLTPYLTVDNNIVEPGATVTTSSRVNNGGPTSSRPTEWQISRFTLNGNENIPNSGGGTSGNGPCSGYFKSGPSCSTLASGNDTFSVGDRTLPNQNDTIGDLPVGSQVCFALSIRPYSQAANDWRHSAPVCVKIGKKPKFQVWTGDVRVGGSVSASISTKNVGGPRTFGSWVEYGVFSGGVNSGLASGSGLAGGSADAGQGSWSKLTFANTSSSYGNFGTMPERPGFVEKLESMASTSTGGGGNINLSTLDTGMHRRSASVTINGTSNIPRGKWVVLSVTGTVTVSGNIIYSNDTITRLSDIPQVVIIADNIVIEGNVTNVDAWLITRGASGYISTCGSNLTIRLTSSRCEQSLQINGPVATNKLYLLRTGGSGTGGASGDPAETFSLRPDAYLWASLRAGSADRAQTVFTTELPPRF